MNYEYNKGYAEGYEAALKDMRMFLNSKDINPIDQMYGRLSAMDGYFVQSAVGATGPMGYHP